MKIPIPMADGEAAVRLAIKTLRNREPQDARIVRIRNTLDLADIHVSEPLCDEVAAHANIEIAGKPAVMSFA